MTDSIDDKKDLLDLSRAYYSNSDYVSGGDGRPRDSFRMPLADEHEVRAVVDGESFPLLDIGSRGIGIQLSDPDRFVRGEFLAHVVIIIGDDKLIMKGKVIHVTREKELTVCGIALKGLDDATEARLQSFLQQHRNIYFVSRG